MEHHQTDSDDDNIFRGTPHKLREVVAPMVKDKVCKYCQTSFSFKNSCKRHEAICKSNKERIAPIFPCLICGREFHRKQNLKRHVKTCQTKTTNKTTVVSCKFCEFKFLKKRYCVKHEKKCDANSDKRHPTLQCCHCESVFHKRCNLIRHLRKCSAKKPQLMAKTPCLVKDCGDSFYHKTDLIRHFSHRHEQVIPIKPKVSNTFASVEDFMKWKEEEEENTFSYFSLKYGKSSKGTQHFYCQHDGSAKLHSKRKTSLRRNLPKIKVGHYCIAKMRLSANDDKTFNLEYYPTHSHALKQEDQQHHPIPAAMSKFIDSKLAEKIPPEVVFELAKEYFTPKNSKKLHNGRADNLTRKIVNERARRRRMALRLDKDDAKSVFLLAAQHIENDDSILIYKPVGMNVVHGPQGINNLPNSNDLFMFGCQTKSQLDLMKMHCSKILIVDETHNTNQYRFQLLTAMVVDEHRRGWPVAHLITSSSTGETLKFFFQTLRERLHADDEVSILNTVITDDDDALINGMTEGFSQTLTHLLCKWHVIKNLKENLRSKGSKDLFDEMWAELKLIMNTKEHSLFLKLKSGFINKYESNPKAAEYMSYLNTYYWNREQKWCMCFRNFPHANVDTTGHLESFHNRLKSYFLKRKPNKRLDDLINLLFDIAWYDNETRRKESKKGFAAQPVQILERHRKGVMLEDNVILEETPESGLWEIKGGRSNSSYFISRLADHCQLDHCFSKCVKNECHGLCAHLFSCSCPDIHPLCKHIHKLQAFLFRNVPHISSEENFYNFETPQNLETCEEQNDDNNELSGKESSNTREKSKKVLWQRLKERLKLFHSFMDQDPENVSEHEMLLLDTAFDALEPTLVSGRCSTVSAVPSLEPFINFAPNEKLQTQMAQLAPFRRPPKRSRKVDPSSLAAKRKCAVKSLLENADTDTADTDDGSEAYLSDPSE